MQHARWLWVLGVGVVACSQPSTPLDASVTPDVATGDTLSLDAAETLDSTIDDVQDESAPDDNQDLDAGDDVLSALDVEPIDASEDDASTWPVCAGDDLAIGADADESRFPSLVWNGTEYGAVWQESVKGDLDIHFVRVSADGAALDDLRVSDTSANDVAPSMAWNGHDYAVAWSTTTGASLGASIRVAMVSVDGRSGHLSVTPAHVVTDMPVDIAANPSIVAIPARDGGGFAVSWEDSRNGADNHEIYFARLDENGAPVGTNVRITNARRLSYSPVLAWNPRGREIGLVWIDDRDNVQLMPNEEIYFARLNTSGTRPAGASDVRITNDGYRSIWPSFTYDATGFAVVWANEAEVADRPHIFFSQRTDDGDARPHGADMFPVSSNPPTIGAWTSAIGWNGSEYLVVWEDQRHPNGDLVVRRFAPNGTALTGEIFLNDDRFFSAHPSLVWSGTNWGLSWEDDRGMHRDVFFRQFARDACLM